VNRTLRVQLGERSYPIVIGGGLLQDRTLLREHIPARQVLLVSNTSVAPLYAAPLLDALSDRQVVEAILPDGEQYKTLDSASRVFDVLMANRFGRDAMIVALGGGVVGDLAGFAAGCYQRGIDFVQLPTTLLADVDSSVGGKTAVNHPGGKNMIGVFHQPRAVLADVALLATLPEREVHAGLAEIIKYGLICDPAFFVWLEQNMNALMARETAALTHAIHRSCEIKAQIVARDERETGERALLNLGHTFGHAIEAATGYTEWLHGEAVGTGMLIAADMSRRLGLLSDQQVQRIARLLAAAGLDRLSPRCGADAAMGYMRIDKKVKSGRVRLILLRNIGEAFITGEYPDGQLGATLKEHFG
jgi:3-dehydroquinate synthase